MVYLIKFNNERPHVASSVGCYMKEHGVSKEEAVKAINEMIENHWINMNEEFMKMKEVPVEILIPIMNLARCSEVIYKKFDMYTHPQHLKETITKLFFEQIHV